MYILPLLFAFAATPAIAAPACPAPLHAGASDLGQASFREDDRVGGAAIDVVRELARRTNCPLDISWYPRARLWAEYAGGRINVTASSARSAERDRLGQFVPFVTTRFDLVLSHRVTGSYKSLAEFVEHSSARLNLVRGILYTPDAEAQVARLREQGRVEVVNDFDIAFRKIASKRAEATLAPMTIYARYLQSADLQGHVSVMQVTESFPVLAGAYLSRSDLSPAARKVFADALLGMVADGTVARIYGKYVGEANGRALVPDHGRGIISAYQQLP
ncbi:substrate-binding periplasmic protein [Pseudoduganella sp. R-43]|uniref:substrate-binding periplasmic protein n=1 Tax=unclassified Pseudoduganella TaxID=2637179 RepID=UPI003CE8117A